MIFCLFNLHLVSYGFGVGEAWNGGEKGEEGSQQKNPRNLRHGGSVGLLWMSVYPGSMDETTPGLAVQRPSKRESAFRCSNRHGRSAASFEEICGQGKRVLILR